MTAARARRARRLARDVLAYRAWAADPATAAIPSASVISNPRIHRHEARREWRLAERLSGPTVATGPARASRVAAPSAVSV